MSKQKHLFDDAKNVKRLIHALWAICGILVILDFILYRKVYHPFENLPAFYPIYGFVGCVVLVVVAKWMRTFLMRSEDYYQKQEQNKKEDKGSDHVSP